MFACICHAVTDTEITAAVDRGAASIEALGMATGAGTGCGSCHDLLEDLVAARCGSCPLVGLAILAVA